MQLTEAPVSLFAPALNFGPVAGLSPEQCAHSIVIGEGIVIVDTRSGAVTIQDGVSLDDASKQFWGAVGRLIHQRWQPGAPDASRADPADDPFG